MNENTEACSCCAEGSNKSSPTRYIQLPLGTGVAIIDSNGTVLGSNPAWAELAHAADVAGSELLPRNWWTHAGSEASRAEPMLHPASVLASVLFGERVAAEAVFLGNRGASVRVAAVRLPSFDTQRALVVLWDVESQEGGARDTQVQKSLLASVTAQMPGIAFQRVLRPDGTLSYTYVSDGLRRIFGIDPEAALGNRNAISRRVHPEDSARFEAALRASAASLEPMTCEVRIKDGAGDWRWVRHVSSPQRLSDGSIRWDGIGLDITDLKRSEAERERLAEELRQAEKLRAIGTLAAGIAHEINNALLPILSIGRDLADCEPAGSERRKTLEILLATAERIRRTVRSLQMHLHRGRKPLRTIELEPAVSHIVELQRHTLCTEIALETEFLSSGTLVRIDADEFHELIGNLIVNARDAIGDSGGRITVTVEHLDDREVRIRVRDTGKGMDEATRSRLFEPFFTTKSVGAGLGLGLAVVHGIIERAGGRIEVESAPGRGAAFTIFLPFALSNVEG